MEQEDALGLEEQGSGMYHLDAERDRHSVSIMIRSNNNNSNNNNTTPQKSNNKNPIVD